MKAELSAHRSMDLYLQAGFSSRSKNVAPSPTFREAFRKRVAKLFWTIDRGILMTVAS